MSMAHLQRPVWIPAHDLADNAPKPLLPIEYFGGGRCLPALVPAGCIDMALLASLKQLMADYGGEIRGAAHAMTAPTPSPASRRRTAPPTRCLRRLAVILFEIYTRASKTRSDRLQGPGADQTSA